MAKYRILVYIVCQTMHVCITHSIRPSRAMSMRLPNGVFRHRSNDVAVVRYLPSTMPAICRGRSLSISQKVVGVSVFVHCVQISPWSIYKHSSLTIKCMTRKAECLHILFHTMHVVFHFGRHAVTCFPPDVQEAPRWLGAA